MAVSFHTGSACERILLNIIRQCWLYGNSSAYRGVRVCILYLPVRTVRFSDIDAEIYFLRGCTTFQSLFFELLWHSHLMERTAIGAVGMAHGGTHGAIGADGLLLQIILSAMKHNIILLIFSFIGLLI